MYFNLARQLAHVGLIEQSITAFWRLLRAPRQSAARQQGFVEELCAVLRSRPPDRRLMGGGVSIPLPRWEQRSIRVILNDGGGDAISPALMSLLVAPLLPPAARARNWLTGAPAEDTSTEHPTVVLGEVSPPPPNCSTWGGYAQFLPPPPHPVPPPPRCPVPLPPLSPFIRCWPRFTLTRTPPTHPPTPLLYTPLCTSARVSPL